MNKLKLYPNIEDVFENPSETIKAIFFPLLTIDLEEMNKGTGKVHFVSLYTDEKIYSFCDGNIFDYEFIKLDWTGEKYNFDDTFFRGAYIEKLIRWYKETETEYQLNKKLFLKEYNKDNYTESYVNKILDDIYQYDQIDDNDIDWIFEEQNEEEIHRGYVKRLINYWITRDKYFQTNKFIQGTAYYDDGNKEIMKPYKSLSKTGATKRKNELVGSLVGYYYLNSGEDEIKLNINRIDSKIIMNFKFS